MTKRTLIAIITIVAILTVSLLAFGAFLMFNGIADVEVTTYETVQDISTLNIDIEAAKLSILKGDKLSVKSNVDGLSVKDDNNGTLSIQTPAHRYDSYKDLIIELYVPENYSFKIINISVNAGDFKAETLCSENLTMQLGAGNVTINTLYVSTKADINVGASALNILSGEITELTINVGVGSVDMNASLLGSSDFELGVGNTTLGLIGPKELYSVEFTNGIGSVTVDGNKMEHGTTCGVGDNRIKISGGVGSATIDFKEKK